MENFRLLLPQNFIQHLVMQKAAAYTFICCRRNSPCSHHHFWIRISPLPFSLSFQGWFVCLGEGCWLPALLSEASLGMDGDCGSSLAAQREICNASSQIFPKGSNWASSPVIWWCQGRAWKCNSTISFDYTQFRKPVLASKELLVTWCRKKNHKPP